MSVIIKQKEQYMRRNSVILLFKKKKARQHLWSGGGGGGGLSHHMCWSLRHCPVPLVPTSPPPCKGNTALHCTAAVSLWWGSVVPVLIQHNAHHLLCPYQWQCQQSCGQTKWAFPPRAPFESSLPLSPSINPPMMLKALIRTASVKEGAGILRLRMRMITDDTTEVLFSLRLLDRAADHAYCL